ncbi:MAG: hypothetical protein FD149_2760 [Rhodospirillaceae bacterium]|nr:MAG: hypothetical protein FD149_2760 [Rhodospirillaceae bacterium]
MRHASYVADGISYLATGKSMSDHGLSAVMQKDCRLWRVVVGETVCVIGFSRGGEGVMVALMKGENAPPVLAALPVVTDANGHHHLPEGAYLVIGSFLNPVNALILAETQEGMDPAIMPVLVHDRQFYRVLIGPVEDVAEGRAVLAEAGYNDAWLFRFHVPVFLEQTVWQSGG